MLRPRSQDGLGLGQQPLCRSEMRVDAYPPPQKLVAIELVKAEADFGRRQHFGRDSAANATKHVRHRLEGIRRLPLCADAGFGVAFISAEAFISADMSRARVSKPVETSCRNFCLSSGK